MSIIEKVYIERAKYRLRNQIKPGAKNIEILTDLRHLGADVNMIDFSFSLYVALYFSCNRVINKFENNYDGEIILLNLPIYNEIRDDLEYKDRRYKIIDDDYPAYIRPVTASIGNNRSNMQSSVFVFNDIGTISIDKYVKITIQHNLKEECIKLLDQEHNINSFTMFNDLSGFIQQAQHPHFLIHSHAIELEKVKKGKEIAKDEMILYEDGCKFMKDELLEDAIQNFSGAIGKKSDFAEAYNNRGACYVRLGNYTLAQEDYNQAIEKNDKLSIPHLNLGLLESGFDRNDNALECLNTAISLETTNARAHYVRSAVYHQMGEFEKAIYDINEAIRLEPENPILYSDRSSIYIQLRELKKATFDLGKAIELGLNDAVHYYIRGVLYSQTNDFLKAISDLSKAIILNPEYTQAYRYRAGVYSEQGKTDKAIDDINKAINLDPKDSIVISDRGIIYFNIGDFNKAMDDINSAINLDPDNAQAYYFRGAVYYNKEKYETAKEDLDNVIRLDSENAKAYLYRGICKLGMKGVPTAKDDIIRSLRIDNNASKLIKNEINNIRALSTSRDEEEKSKYEFVIKTLEDILVHTELWKKKI